MGKTEFTTQISEEILNRETEFFCPVCEKSLIKRANAEKRHLSTATHEKNLLRFREKAVRASYKDPYCYCCQAVSIQKHSRLGLIISEKNGGKRTQSNMRPVCSHCYELLLKGKNLSQVQAEKSVPPERETEINQRISELETQLSKLLREKTI
jgi:predicted RNA-binding Zn-ribbon protein involved in translation (DUF1610 family)